MPTLLNIHGPCAVGKSTTVANLLPHLNGYVFIDRAYIKHHLKALGKEEARRVAKEGVYRLLEECCKRKADILTQELSPDSIRARLGSLLDGYRLLSFRLHASLPVTLERNERRGKNVETDHVKRIYQRCARQRFIEDILIDTEEHPPEEVVELILGYVA